MRFGIHVHGLHPTDTPADDTFETILEQVRTARDHDFDLAWAGQHYAMERYQKFQPVPALARIAGESGDMHLGLNILLPLAHPVAVAEAVATVDALSGGRTILSPIAGYRQSEFDALGVSLSERAGRLAEGVTAIERLWTEDAVTVDGEYYAFENVTITPKPVQSPRPPIWIGANEPTAVERAARLGDAWFIAPALSEAAIRDRLDRIGRPAGNGYRGTQPAMRRMFVAESDEAAREIYGTAIRDQFDWHADAAGDDGPALPPFDELVEEGYLVGSPETVADGLVQLHDELGIGCVVMSTHRPGVPHDAVLDSIRLTGERVIPTVRERVEST